MPSKLTLVGTYLGVLSVTLSVVFFYLSYAEKKPAGTELEVSDKGNIHITGLLDHDKYLDEALLVYPRDVSNTPGLYLRLSESIKNRNYEDEKVDLSHFTETITINVIGMDWEGQDITMRFDNKSNVLILNSSQTRNSTTKEKEITLSVLKDFNLPYIKSYKMMVNDRVSCNIDFHAGYGIKENVRFQVAKQIPLFVWDSSSIPQDCQ